MRPQYDELPVVWFLYHFPRRSQLRQILAVNRTDAVKDIFPLWCESCPVFFGQHIQMLLRMNLICEVSPQQKLSISYSTQSDQFHQSDFDIRLPQFYSAF